MKKGQLFSNSSLFFNLNSHLPCNITYSQVLGLGHLGGGGAQARKLITVCYWIAVGYLEILDFFPNAKSEFVSWLFTYRFLFCHDKYTWQSLNYLFYRTWIMRCLLVFLELGRNYSFVKLNDYLVVCIAIIELFPLSLNCQGFKNQLVAKSLGVLVSLKGVCW